MKKVAVSVHARDNFKLELIKNLKGLDYIHVDVSDGIFSSVRNLNLEIFHNLKSEIAIPIIAHMMVVNPLEYLNKIIKFVDIFTIHLEIGKNIAKIIEKIKNEQKGVGIAVNPDTDIEELIPYLKAIDLVLIMSVYPGGSGQKFIPQSIKKVQRLKTLKEKYDFLIEIDGGINTTNAKKLDVDILSSTSTILNSSNPNETIRLLKFSDESS